MKRLDRAVRWVMTAGLLALALECAVHFRASGDPGELALVGVACLSAGFLVLTYGDA